MDTYLEVAIRDYGLEAYQARDFEHFCVLRRLPGTPALREIYDYLMKAFKDCTLDELLLELSLLYDQAQTIDGCTCEQDQCFSEILAYIGVFYGRS